MEQVYALGITCIQFIQDRFSDYDTFFHVVNDVSNPYHIVQYMLPLLAALDSVFAAQFLLCMGFGNWLNAVMKWWLLEDRPYWWVRETSFYADVRPVLRQFPDTCETGPGSPSGHSATAASVLMLLVMWMSHVMHDRHCPRGWWVPPIYTMLCVCLCSVLAARLYVAAHFPHQVLLGGLVGGFLSPFLCIYVSDPFIFQYGAAAKRPVKVYMWWHVVFALLCVVVAALTYLALLAAGLHPMWTVHLAFRWCEFPESIRVSTSPMFALVAATATLLGWAITVTPHVARYRHDTKARTLFIAVPLVTLINYSVKYFEDNICDYSALWYYSNHFFIDVLKCFLYLRLVPYLAMLPYTFREGRSHQKSD